MSRLIEQMEPEDPPSTGDLDFEPASFSKSLPSFAIPADRFATVFSECVASGGSRSACDVNVSQLIKDIASGKKTGQPLNVPVVCDSCGSGSQMAPPDVSSHPDVLSMLRNVLDRLSTIDTRLERVEKIVNAEFFSKAMDIAPVLRLPLVPSSFDALWFDMRNQLEDPAYLTRLEVEDRKIQGRWRAGAGATFKGIYNRRRNIATNAGDDSSSSSSSASDAYGGVANDTEAGDGNAGLPAAETTTASVADQSLNTTAAEGTDHVADDVEIPTDTWMDDGGGLEAFVADVVSSQMDIASGPGSSESNSDNSGMPS